MFNFVMIPRQPSEPMNNYFKSNPVLSFLLVEDKSNISPVGKTTSIPKMYPLSNPFFTTLSPPALVDTFPPI